MNAALPWFRLYTRMVDDEKVRLLAFEDRWHFVALCCLKGDGLLDEPNDDLRQRKIAVKLGVQIRELDEIGRRLQEVGLVDDNLNPLAWDDLQFRSDSSTERVRKYREKTKPSKVKRPRNVSVTGQDKDTDTDTEIVTPLSPPTNLDREFEESFWPEFPNKVGKREALRAFVSARKRVSLETIMDGLRRYAAKTDDRPWCNPSTFLNQDRWADAPAQAPPRQGKLTTARVLADLANRMRVNENGTSPDPPRLTHVGRVSGE